MCYMESPVPSRVEFLVSALEIRPRHVFNVNNAGHEDEQTQRREDGITLFLHYYRRFTQSEGQPWPGHGLAEEVIGFGLMTLDYIVALRSIELRAGIWRTAPTPVEVFDDLSLESIFPFVEEEEREGDWETAGTSIMRDGQDIWSTRAPSPLDLGESEESLAEIDARDAGAEWRHGSSHRDHTGPQVGEPLPTHLSPRATIDLEERSTSVDLQIASLQNSDIESGRQEQDQQLNGNGDVAL